VTALADLPAAVGLATTPEPTDLTNGKRPSRTVREFLDEPEPEHDWLIEDLLEREDRVVLTGPEGGGKSTFLRQFAVQLAAGLHPFELCPIEPRSVFLVDLENGRRHLRRSLRTLYSKVAGSIEPERLRVCSHPAGIDLGLALWAEWLAERVDANRPDLLVIGPIYKMSSGDSTTEEVARKITVPLDRIRSEFHCAVVLEGHSPYSAAGGRRPTRPFGSSVWSRWPEFGLHLSETGQLSHWRGDRDERAWPAGLKRGGDWPWTVEADPRSITFAGILEEVRSHGGPLSLRDLADRLGASKSAIDRAINANRAQWDKVLAEVEG